MTEEMRINSVFTAMKGFFYCRDLNKKMDNRLLKMVQF